jgi:transcription-repair coupling factor (superfamily II helicase)
MDAFYNHEIDVLLSTSIIESGLDVPNANTLIADRADMLGLAQLYQIRGRVGRSSQRAYAYFFQQRSQRPTDEGLERLEVIAENTQLGAGYSIALRDLEMRGAGEILGNRQHGSIASVGFHLYTRMLAQAVKTVREIRGLESDESSDSANMIQTMLNPVSVELPIDVGIPEEYVTEQKMRIKLYRRIASVHDEFELAALEEEFKERFGPLPESVENLFFQIRVKIRAESIGLAAVIREGMNVQLRFPALPAGVEKRDLPVVGSGIQAGKNAYRLMNLNFEDNDWKEILIGDMDRVQYHLRASPEEVD